MPRVQLMRGWGCPETPHSKVTLSPISTSVFCGWITKVGLAGRKRVLQKPEALLPAQARAGILWTPHATQLAAWLFPDLQILTVSNPPNAASSHHLLIPVTSCWSFPTPVSPSSLLSLCCRIPASRLPPSPELLPVSKPPMSDAQEGTPLQLRPCYAVSHPLPQRTKNILAHTKPGLTLT